MSKQVRLPDGTAITDCFSDSQGAAVVVPASDQPERLSLGQSRVPDVLECLANLSSDEVFTPPRIANEMLDLLPAEVWTDPTLRWLDPGCKSGVFLREAARRLMVGLSEAIPDPDERRHHIFTEMLHGYAITELTAMISRRTLYYTKDATSEDLAVVAMPTPEGNIRFERGSHSFQGGSCTACGASDVIERGDGLENHAYAFLHGADTKNMQFDVIIGNPPYQLPGTAGNRDVPLYHRFVEQAKQLKPRYMSFIIPSRWFAGGWGLDGFRSEMLSDRRLRVLVDYPDAAECFPDIDLGGGVCYFLWEAAHNADCAVTTVLAGQRNTTAQRNLAEFDVFVRANEAIPIISKVRALGEPDMSKDVSPGVPFGLRSNFVDYKPRRFRGAVKLYARNGTVGWVAPAKIAQNSAWVADHKVLLANAYGERGSGPYHVLGKPIVAEPNSACTQTYIVAGRCQTAVEAENLAAYLRTRFVRFLVSLRKNTQHVKVSTFAFVPALDMTVRWTDQMLYQRYGLTQDEIDFIESRIKEMT